MGLRVVQVKPDNNRLELTVGRSSQTEAPARSSSGCYAAGAVPLRLWVRSDAEWRVRTEDH
jgi:hypothetical protein